MDPDVHLRSVSPAATNDMAEWRLLPTVVFQEFSSEQPCMAAKSTLENSLKDAGEKLRRGLEDLRVGLQPRDVDHALLLGQGWP